MSAIAPRPSDANDLHDALERYLALTEVALHACDENDAEGIHIALDARDILGERVARLSTALASRRRLADSEAGTIIFEQLMAPVHATARHIQRVDEELEARVARRRHETGRQLERLAQDDAGITAYAAPGPREDARLDLRS